MKIRSHYADRICRTCAESSSDRGRGREWQLFSAGLEQLSTMYAAQASGASWEQYDVRRRWLVITMDWSAWLVLRPVGLALPSGSPRGDWRLQNYRRTDCQSVGRRRCAGSVSLCPVAQAVLAEEREAAPQCQRIGMEHLARAVSCVICQLRIMRAFRQKRARRFYKTPADLTQTPRPTSGEEKRPKSGLGTISRRVVPGGVSKRSCSRDQILGSRSRPGAGGLPAPKSHGP